MKDNFFLSPRYNILKPKTEPRRILIHGIHFIITIDSNEKLAVIPNQSILIKDGTIIKQFPKEKLHQEVEVGDVDLIYDDTVTFWVFETLFSWLQYAKIRHFD